MSLINMSSIENRIGRILHGLRLTLRVSRQDLADEAGIEIKCLDQIEAGRGASPTEVASVARVLGYSYADVVEEAKRQSQSRH